MKFRAFIELYNSKITTEFQAAISNLFEDIWDLQDQNDEVIITNTLIGYYKCSSLSDSY